MTMFYVSTLHTQVGVLSLVYFLHLYFHLFNKNKKSLALISFTFALFSQLCFLTCLLACFILLFYLALLILCSLLSLFYLAWFDCAWLVCSRSLLRSQRPCLVCSICVDCNWFAHSRSSLRSHGPNLAWLDVYARGLACSTCLGSLTR